MSDTRRTVEQLLAQLGAGEPQRIADCFVPEAVDWYGPGAESPPWTGRRSTRAEIVDYFRQFSGVFIAGPDDITIQQLLIDGDDAILLGAISRTIALSHRTFTTPMAMHLTVQDGLIARLHLYEDTLIVARAFDVQGTVGEASIGKPLDHQGFQGGSAGRLAGKAAVIYALNVECRPDARQTSNARSPKMHLAWLLRVGIMPMTEGSI